MVSRVLLWFALLVLVPAVASGQSRPVTGDSPGLGSERPAFLNRTERGSVSHARRKVSSAVRDALTRVQAETAEGAGTASQAPSASRVRMSPAGDAQVYVTLNEHRPEHVAQLQALGMRVELTLPERGLVQGWIPARAVDQAAALAFVKTIREPDYAVRRGAGAVNTAGDGLMRVEAARAAFGTTGAGVRVGVISNGVERLANSVASGDLPADVQVLEAGSGNEGTAMLEIVHDLAPGAALAFHGPLTSAGMVQAISSLGAAGARVVVDDLGFYSEPKFEDGMVAQAARAFAVDGRVYVTAAGNDAQSHYRAGYNRHPVESPGDYPFIHNYASGAVDLGNSVTIPTGCAVSVLLQWNNPFGKAADDLDLFISRSSDGVTLANSVDVQDGTQDPLEVASWSNRTGAPATVSIAVTEFKLASAPASLILDYFILASCVLPGAGLQYVQSADSIFGHPAVAEVVSVAALRPDSPDVAQDYSSRGPASISFPVPEVRAVPSASGIDCVSTHTGQLGFFAEPFCGTSAAAPHVAAIAALLIERAPALSSKELLDVLTGTAVDLGAPGFDFTYGSGRIDALDALGAAPPNTVVSLSGTQFHPGQSLSVTLWAQNPSGQPPLDLYVGAILPDGQTVAFASAPGVLGGIGSLGAPAAIPAAQAAPGGFVLESPSFLRYTFPAAGTIPAGRYVVFAALVKPGALADNQIDPGDVVDVGLAEFTFSP